MPWLPAEVTVAPAAEPVSIAEARKQAAIADGDITYDTELTIYIKAAREHVEKLTGTKLITQTVVLRADNFSALCRLPVVPLQAVTSIKYLDAADVEQTVDPAVYEPVLVGRRPFVRLKSGQAWPPARCVRDAVRVTVTAGYGAAAAVPAPVKQALLLLIGAWFRDREDSSQGQTLPIPNGAQALLANYSAP